MRKIILDYQQREAGGFVYSPHEDHKDSYKYISITTYGYKEKETSHYVKKIVNNSGIKSEIISPNAFIDGTVSKVVYNGQVFRTSEKQSGILQKISNRLF